MHRPQASAIRNLAAFRDAFREQLVRIGGIVAAETSRTLRVLEDGLARALRQRQRYETWGARHARYYRAGLNGKRAVERRQRQIAAGQLREANGLMRSAV